MKRTDAAILGIRLAALYAWFQAVEYVAFAFMGLSLAQSKPGMPGPGSTLAFIAPCVAMFLVGLFLFLRAPALARYFLPADESAESGPISVAPSLAFAVVGLAAFLYALPNVVSYTLYIAESSDIKGEFYRYGSQIVACWLQFALGFMLFVRPHRLAAWWQRKRQKNPPPVGNDPAD